MSASAQTRIFGIRLGVDPKILAGALVALAVFLFWFNSRGDDVPNTSSSNSHLQSGAPIATRPSRHAVVSRRASASDRDVLKVREIDPTRGEIDPTLRLGVLARLQTADLKPATRNLFEPGQPVQTAAGGTIKGPIIQPKPLAAPSTSSSASPPPPIQANIPLKYYGFARPVSRAEANRGFFLDGDNVLIASEGETVKNRYLVVQLTPQNAKLEDTQIKLGQTLPVVAEAVEQ